ncbi:MAG: hypothetical protein ACI9TH_001359 [Kiritimatiellia bacterium]
MKKWASILPPQKGLAAAGALGMVLYVAVIVFGIVCMWKIYTKAGKPGWASIAPIYNIILLEIVGRPLWWIVLMFIPFVNVVIFILVLIDLAKSFGKGAGFGIGLLFLGIIFFPMRAFGSAKYAGPAAAVTPAPAVA